ncbi:hypothetical protein H5P36_25015 [Bacillus sp. APMAM]|nr:hypothetical protein [Bacillus sp. APMAM]RTZ53150.1 hypothetical protein EKO25_24950 [Bacillus sp. SAJ1]
MEKDMFDLDLKVSSSKEVVEPNTITPIRITTTCWGCAGPIISRKTCGTTSKGCDLPFTMLCNTKSDCMA